MGKRDLSAALKQRSNEDIGNLPTEPETADMMIDKAYESLFGGITGEQLAVRASIRLVSANKLHAFFTAKIGFRKYSDFDLHALADDITANGVLEHIKVRPMQNGDYEILSGHNRVAACRLLGWSDIPVEVEQADDDRAITIATVTNLKRRQSLLPSERGWAYRALMEAQKRRGKRTDLEDSTCGQIAHRSKTRDKIAAYFGVEVTKLRRDIQLTYLIPPLLDAIDDKRLKIGCSTVISSYNIGLQDLFLKQLEQAEWKVSLAVIKQIGKFCPADRANEATLLNAWESALIPQKAAATSSKQIVFQRKALEPYLKKIGDEKALEVLFLEFLKERCG